MLRLCSTVPRVVLGLCSWGSLFVALRVRSAGWALGLAGGSKSLAGGGISAYAEMLE